MKKHKEEDLKLVTERFLHNKRHPITSEFFRNKILTMAKNAGEELPYVSFYPYSAIWKINSDCNLRCKHCYFYEGEQYNTDYDLSTESIFRVIQQLANANIIEIRLTGGEIFLRKDIFKIIEQIKNANMSIIITTNGTMLTNQKITTLAKFLNPKTDVIRVSLDGADASTNDFTRGNGNFLKTVNTIKSLIKQNLNVFVSTTVTKQNVNQLPDIYKLSRDLGVKQITLIKVIPISENQNYLVPEFEELVSSCAKIYEHLNGNEETILDNRLFAASDFVNRKISKELILHEIKKQKFGEQKIKNFHCNEDKSFYIDSDGLVYLCPLAADYKLFTLGDLKKENLEKIFENRSNNPLFQKRNFSQSFCNNCEILSYCRGGCAVLSYLKSNNLNAPSGDCKSELD